MSLKNIGKSFAKMSFMIFITTIIFTAIARMFRTIGRFLLDTIIGVYLHFSKREVFYSKYRIYRGHKLNLLINNMEVFYALKEFGVLCDNCKMHVPKDPICLNCGEKFYNPSKKLLPNFG